MTDLQQICVETVRRAMPYAEVEGYADGDNNVAGVAVRFLAPNGDVWRHAVSTSGPVHDVQATANGLLGMIKIWEETKREVLALGVH